MFGNHKGRRGLAAVDVDEREASIVNSLCRVGTPFFVVGPAATAAKSIFETPKANCTEIIKEKKKF